MLCIFPESKNVSMQWLSVNSHSISAKKKIKTLKLPLLYRSHENLSVLLYIEVFLEEILFIYSNLFCIDLRLWAVRIKKSLKIWWEKHEK